MPNNFAGVNPEEFHTVAVYHASARDGINEKKLIEDNKCNPKLANARFDRNQRDKSVGQIIIKKF